MRRSAKLITIYITVLSLSVLLVTQLAQARQNYEIEVVEDAIEESAEALDQAALDNILAPIALYPDTLLSHIFIASTLPLEVVQAARWRAENQDYSADQAVDAVEQQDWDPSIKALVAFPDLLERMNNDLDWLAALGDAFVRNEEQVLTSVQNLRSKAYAQGNLQDNDYIEVVEEDDQILIQPVHKEVVYVPYYDTRVVYGNWWWQHQPYYWHRPANYYWYAGFYWSPRIYVRPYYFDFGRVYWHKRHVVINHPYHYKSYRYKHHYKPRYKGYVHWRKHAKHHKRKTRQYVRSYEHQAKKVDHRQVKKRLVSHQQHKKHAYRVNGKHKQIARSSGTKVQNQTKSVHQYKNQQKVKKHNYKTVQTQTQNKSGYRNHSAPKQRQTYKMRENKQYAKNSYTQKRASDYSYKAPQKTKGYSHSSQRSGKVRHVQKRAYEKSR